MWNQSQSKIYCRKGGKIKVYVATSWLWHVPLLRSKTHRIFQQCNTPLFLGWTTLIWVWVVSWVLRYVRILVLWIQVNIGRHLTTSGHLIDVSPWSASPQRALWVVKPCRALLTNFVTSDETFLDTHIGATNKLKYILDSPFVHSQLNSQLRLWHWEFSFGTGGIFHPLSWPMTMHRIKRGMVVALPLVKSEVGKTQASEAWASVVSVWRWLEDPSQLRNAKSTTQDQ